MIAHSVQPDGLVTVLLLKSEESGMMINLTGIQFFFLVHILFILLGTVILCICFKCG
jgi:hypothetical protein